MYTLTVKDSLIAQHYLTVPNCGTENKWHSHHFEVEIILKTSNLNKWGYVCDIDDVKGSLTDLNNRFSDQTLNELEAFEGMNPSVEHFARIAAEYIRDTLDDETRTRCHELQVCIWEDAEAAARYTMTLDADA